MTSTIRSISRKGFDKISFFKYSKERDLLWCNSYMVVVNDPSLIRSIGQSTEFFLEDSDEFKYRFYFEKGSRGFNGLNIERHEGCPLLEDVIGQFNNQDLINSEEIDLPDGFDKDIHDYIINAVNPEKFVVNSCYDIPRVWYLNKSEEVVALLLRNSINFL